LYPLPPILTLPMRNQPNIIITGTPGVGKTTTCDQLVALSSTSSSPGSAPLQHLSINALVKDRGCHEGYDDDLKTYIVDEDKLLDEVEKEIGEGPDGEGANAGGWLIDWHACDLFPKSWVDLVVVLRCERTDVLWDRLKARYVI
jgi:adenylate kinase